MQYLVFEVQNNQTCHLASSYLEVRESDDIDQVIEKALAFYNRENCFVQVLMGERLENLTRQPTVPLKELLSIKLF